MIMGLRAHPKMYRNMGRKCKQEPYFFKWIKSTTKRCTNLQKIQAHIQIAGNDLSAQ